VQRGGVLITGIRDTISPPYQPTIRNPDWGPQHAWQSRPIFQTLMWNDPHNQDALEGYLVDQWDFAPTGDSITFHVNEEAMWSDGLPVTARDVEFTLNHWISPPEGFSITRGPDIAAKSLGSVELIDDYTIKVILSSVDVSILSSFANYHAYVYPAHKTLEETANNPIGSGAFEPVDIQTDVKITYVKNPNYWIKGPLGEQLPYLDGIESIAFFDGSRSYAAIVTGQLDLFHAEVSFVVSGHEADITRRMPGAILQTRFATSSGWGFRNKPPFDDLRITKAFYIATDRMAWLELANNGNGVIDTVGVTPGSSGNTWALPMEEVMSTPGYRYLNKATGELELDVWKVVAGLSSEYEKDPADIQMAKDLLAEAGFAPGEFPKLDVMTDSSYNEPEATVLQQQLKEDLGVEMILDVVDFTSAQERRANGSFDVNVSWTHPATTDPSLSLAYFTEEPPFHFAGGFPTPELNDLWAQQKREIDPTKRLELVHAMQRQIIEKPHIIPSLGFHAASGISREWVKNLPLPRVTATTVWYWDQVWIDRDVPGRR
jgi:ABC-type transport system substrate-binding protein